MWPEILTVAAYDNAKNDIGMSRKHHPWQECCDPAGQLALAGSHRGTRNQGTCPLQASSNSTRGVLDWLKASYCQDDVHGRPNHKRGIHQRVYCKCGSGSSHPVDRLTALLLQGCQQRPAGQITRWKWTAYCFPVSGSHRLCIHVLVGRSCQLQCSGGLWCSAMEHEVQEVLGHAPEQQGGSSLND